MSTPKTKKELFTPPPSISYVPPTIDTSIPLIQPEEVKMIERLL
ncbi:hypothetical protein LINPERHAP1_LOCUS7823, partial [Linum perenne]